MQKFISMMAVGLIIVATNLNAKPKPCGKHEGHNLYKGEKGGCYYLKTKKKVKVYIDKKYCNC